jgi:hypothetical protein
MALRSFAGPATAAASNSNRRVFCDENADIAAVNGRKAAATAVGGLKVKTASAAAGGMVWRQSVRAPLACLSNKAEQAPGQFYNYLKGLGHNKNSYVFIIIYSSTWYKQKPLLVSDLRR